MSVTQTPPEQSQLDTARCSRCKATLPQDATFCGRCGERVQKTAHGSSSPLNADVEERYRITSLVRRYPYVQIFLALDIESQHPMVIRDIDINSLEEAKRAKAVEIVQDEYDLLSDQKLIDVLPVIDLRFFNGHLSTIMNWPFAYDTVQHSSHKSAPTCSTLQDLLHSGIGQPDEEIALTWLYRLSSAVARLHQQQIVVGDIDPYTIAVGDDGYDGLPALMVSWLPATLRTLLPHTSASANTSNHFYAPEALAGQPEERSDVYSLGALLYLLLVGTAPEEPLLREQKPLRSPREMNTAINTSIDELVMRALSLDPAERFQSASELADALLALCSSTRPVRLQPPSALPINEPASSTQEPIVQEPAIEENEDEDDENNDVTIKVTPVQMQLARQHLDLLAPETSSDDTAEPESSDLPDQPTVLIQQPSMPTPEAPSSQDTTLPPTTPEEQPASSLQSPPPHPLTRNVDQLVHRVRNRLSGVLPNLHISKELIPAAPGQLVPVEQQPKEDENSLLRRLQRFILGEQQHSTNAAALIETPLRVQPDQAYYLRIHLMGRDQARLGPGVKKGTPAVGLSSKVQGELIYIEVRSALYHNYAYIVQRAKVHIPQQGFAAEVSIPLQKLGEHMGGRRERLHVFFMDEQRRPLYEKPFVIEVFISPLVQSGREGHNVLSIPV